MSGSLRAWLSQAPDHYELLDRRLVGRLGGVLFLVGALLATLLMWAEPPTRHLSPGLGWSIASAVVVAAVALGVVMLQVDRYLPAPVLVLIGLLGPLMIGVLQWLSGAGSTFDALLGLSVMWAGVVLPAPKLMATMTCTTAIAVLPLLSGRYHQELLDRKLVNVAFLWVLVGACVVWSTRVRDIRRELRDERAAADRLARVDALTGLGNRRALDEALAAQVALAGRTGRPLSALVGDLDGFKAINDDHGHHVGDRLLRDVAGVLRDVVRRPDACFRWGGDEFVVLLAEVDGATAQAIGERVSAAVASRCGASYGAHVGLSVGAATLVEDGRQLLADADAALLAAKSLAGRRVP